MNKSTIAFLLAGGAMVVPEAVRAQMAPPPSAAHAGAETLAGGVREDQTRREG